MFAGFHARDGQGGMPVVRGGDGDGVDVFALENFAEVAAGLWRIAEFLLSLGGKLRQDVAFNVAHVCHASGVAIGREGGEMRVAAAVESDDGEVEPVVRAHDLRIAFRRAADGEPSRSDRHRVQKIATCNHAVSVKKRTRLG